MDRRRRLENLDQPADWITTYSDMVTLLLTFFVMLFSMSTVDKAKFDRISASLGMLLCFNKQAVADY